jgi:hypothetical protein
VTLNLTKMPANLGEPWKSGPNGSSMSKAEPKFSRRTIEVGECAEGIPQNTAASHWLLDSRLLVLLSTNSSQRLILSSQLHRASSQPKPRQRLHLRDIESLQSVFNTIIAIMKPVVSAFNAWTWYSATLRLRPFRLHLQTRHFPLLIRVKQHCHISLRNRHPLGSRSNVQGKRTRLNHCHSSPQALL